LGRLLRVGALVVAAAVAVNVVVRTVAVSLFGIGEGFLALDLGPTVMFTVIGVAGAVVVFGLISRFSRRPVRLFRWVALVVLVISLIPDVLVAPSIPGATIPGVLTLMIEHVASWAVAVTLLPRLTAGQGERRG
jgi:Family of unknown function (DUF6069)